MKRLWGKRFTKEPSVLAQNFTSGRDVQAIPPADERLIPYDLWGSRAHVLMLAKQKIIPRKEARALIKGLKEIESLWKKGSFTLAPAKEDVHSNVESWLIKKYGIEAGGRLHTARSRNDQIVLDMRLYLRDCALDFLSEILALIKILIDNAEKYRETITPGYTHHQPAQVTTLGHVWLSFAEALLRDAARFRDWHQRFNQNPLGSMTGYGTSFPIDRNLTSKLLAFTGPCQNSLDPIQNRWEPEAEMAFAIAAMMNHLSSIAQTLILFSTEEFGLIRLDDAHCSGSSMMPQKRNPDTLEVVKAKSAVAQGSLMSLLSIGKSLFLGYNRDTQWTKYLIIDLIDECALAPRVMSEIIGILQVNEKKAAALCQKGFITAPDLLELLVQKESLPFRQAKGLIEKAVKYSEGKGAGQILPWGLEKALQEERLSLKIDEKMVAAGQDPKLIISRRRAIGGPSSKALQKNSESVSKQIQIFQMWLTQKRKQQSSAKTQLVEMERSL